MIRNIFGLASRLLPKQQALLFRWKGRELNERGLDVDAFEPPVIITGIIQAVDRSRYGYMGLDAAKSYIAVYATVPLADLTRTGNPDQLEYSGRRYRVLNRSEWTKTADYDGVLAMDIGPATEAHHVSDGK